MRVVTRERAAELGICGFCKKAHDERCRLASSAPDGSRGHGGRPRKISDRAVRMIRSAWFSATPFTEERRVLAANYGVSYDYAWMIANGRAR